MTYAEAVEVFEALWEEARALNRDLPGDWATNLAPDLAVARAVNGLPPACLTFVHFSRASASVPRVVAN